MYVVSGGGGIGGERRMEEDTYWYREMEFYQ
jgi:hypothetical protein